MSGFWNVALEPMLDHIDAWKRGDVEAARKIWNGGLCELQTYQKETGRLHVRYKIGAWLRGLIDRPDTRVADAAAAAGGNRDHVPADEQGRHCAGRQEGPQDRGVASCRSAALVS